MLLLGAAYAVLGDRASEPATDRTRAELQRLVGDAATVLGGMRDARGLALDADLIEALHCGADATPSATSCYGGKGANLSLKLESYLPPGAQYAVLLDNGAAKRIVWRPMDPPGEAVADSVAYAPDWNLTFVLPELSCYDSSAMALNATLLPLANGSLAPVLSGNSIVAGGAQVNVTNSTTLPGALNVSVGSGMYAAGGTVTSNLTSKRGALPGFSAYGACALGAAGTTLEYALRNATLAPSIPSVPVGGAVTFAVGLAPLSAVPGATLGAATLTVYDPLPERNDSADSWIATTPPLPVPAGLSPSVAWSAPWNATYGVHPVVLRQNLTLNGVTIEARLLTTISVALSSGVVPVEPTYRLSLQAWFRDWR
jgi:hypothetical protein